MTEAQAETAPEAAPPARAVQVHLAEVMARRGVGVGELAERTGMHPNNVTRIKNGHAEGIRWPTLGALCEALECQPGDLLTYG
jgi:putative transcriptional regulator